MNIDQRLTSEAFRSHYLLSYELAPCQRGTRLLSMLIAQVIFPYMKDKQLYKGYAAIATMTLFNRAACRKIFQMSEKDSC